MDSSLKSGSKQNDKTCSSGAQSVQRAMVLLRAVATRNEYGVNLSRLARGSGLNISTTRRILQVMVQEGLITYDKVSKLYHLGLELYRMGSAARQYAVRDRFRPALESIAIQSHDTVFLLIRSGNDVLCADVVQGEFPIRTIMIEVGARRPLGIGAGSLALIAFGSEDELERVLDSNAPRYPQYRGLTSEDIRSMALEARTRGFVLSDGLFHDDAVSVGVPVFDREGKILAAVTVSAIRPRMEPERQKNIAALVKEATRPNIIGL